MIGLSKPLAPGPSPKNGESGERRPRSPRRAGGSVLVFSVVVLTILAMLAATFLLTARQSFQVTHNVINNASTDLAVQSGLQHAMRILHSSVRGLAIVTPEGVFRRDAASGNGLFTLGDADTQGPAFVSYFKQFSDDPISGAGPLLCGADQNLHFTDAPLRVSSTIDLRERAFKFAVSGATANVYHATGNKALKEMPVIGGYRGEYHVWISDLDSKLYAVPANWGLDTTNITGAPAPAAISHDILALLKSRADMPELADADIVKICDPAQLPASASFASLSDFTQEFDSIDPANPNPLRADLEYYFTTNFDAEKLVKASPAGLNANTAPLEVLEAALSQIPAEDSTNPAATLGTKIAYIDPTTNASITLAQGLAKRIVAKRPFLCRMDFEDFLAAHIKGTSKDPAGANPLLIPLDSDALWTTPTDPTWAGDPPVAYMLYYAIGRRLGPVLKDADGNPLTTGRWPLLAHGDADPPELETPELTLAQYLEMPAVAEDDVRFKGANTPEYQKLRFRYFFDDISPTGSPYISSSPRAYALLTVKEFNNVINSVSHTGAGDDVQLLAVNATGSDANALAIAPGPDGVLGKYTLAGDDFILKHIQPGAGHVITLVDPDVADGNGNIYPGPTDSTHSLHTPIDELQGDKIVTDGIAVGSNLAPETFVPFGAASYYSFCDDYSYASTFWEKITAALKTEPTFATLPSPTLGTSQVAGTTFDATTLQLIKDAEADARRYMKLYYRRPLVMTTDPATGITVLTPSLAGMLDLASWRCQPPPGVDRKSGMFEMSFDNFSSGIGNMQTLAINAQPTTVATAQISTRYVPMAIPSGAAGDGDVSWSPQLSFRSRFFGIYVLGRGLVCPPLRTAVIAADPAYPGGYPAGYTATLTLPGKVDSSVLVAFSGSEQVYRIQTATYSQAANSTALLLDEPLGFDVPAGANVTFYKYKPASDRRMEAVYDAYKDEILWQRAQVSDKRSLGDP